MEEDLTYPKEDEDLKRRVAGEVLRLLEQGGEMPSVAEVVEIIEGVCSKVHALMRREELPLRRIDLRKETESCLNNRGKNRGEPETGG
ncbi:MAG: hypothetical protein GXY54_06870 [Deltaproteobacteria bacterium]|nr:hypothetical protein [Deltaproteobacteria bacterium]